MYVGQVGTTLLSDTAFPTVIQMLNSLVSKYFFPKTPSAARKMARFMPDFPDNLMLVTCLGVLTGHLDTWGRPICALPAPPLESPSFAADDLLLDDAAAAVGDCRHMTSFFSG